MCGGGGGAILYLISHDTLISYFSTDKTLGTGYDIYFLCALIADDVTLLVIVLLYIWGLDALQKLEILQKNSLIFSIFGNLSLSSS